MENDSDFPKGKPKSLASRRNMEKLRLELSKINGGVQSFAPGKGINRNWGVPRYGIGEVHDQTEEHDPEYNKGNDSVFNYTDDKEPVTYMKFPAVGSIAEPVPDPLFKPFVCNVSAPKSCDVHRVEGFSGNASDISNAKGLMELQQRHEEENASDEL
ncbi:uncharacterized protein LOC124844541 [Vigna umbellata]|uniref:uncharacterized protein LOC124844541 n=1 Tax=Vigna umbellata TaxID=87088 RepID=UPI001F5E3703|nr:uncharacterized protein LOC124844541 [Vigna umbellata]